MARPTRLDKDIIAKSIEAVSSGANYAMLSDCLGVAESTIYEWKKRGREDIEAGLNTIYAEFLDNIKKCRYQYEQSLCAEIQRQGFEGAWQANCWLLERRNPKVFGKDANVLREIAELKEALASVVSMVDCKTESKV